MIRSPGLDALYRKIVKKEDLQSLSENLRALDKRIVTTNGAFDLLHIGHVHSLMQAKMQGDVLIVGVNSDASVKRYKGESRPVIPEDERALMLASLEIVDYLFIYDDDTPIPWIPLIRPHVHVKGSDRTLAEIVERAVVEEYGGTILLAPHTGIHSTSAIITRTRGK